GVSTRARRRNGVCRRPARPVPAVDVCSRSAMALCHRRGTANSRARKLHRGRAGADQRGHLMKRWLPHPLLTILLLLAWLLLQRSMAPRSIVFGIVLALVLCQILDRLQ